MKTGKIAISAIVIAALMIGLVTVSFAASSEQSCCSYMKTNVCAQYMQGLTPEQKVVLDKDFQRKVDPAESQYYPGGTKYLPGAY